MLFRILLLPFLVTACGARSALEQSVPDSSTAAGGTGTDRNGGGLQGGTSAHAGAAGAPLTGGMVSWGGTTANASAGAAAGSCVESMCTSGGWCWLNPVPQGNSLFDTLVRDGEFWATGDDGLVLRGDGHHWLRCPTPTTESLRGSWFSPKGIFWTVGTGGVVLSFDGVSWTQHYAEHGLFLNDVNGSRDDDVWVVGDRVVLHFDGRNWDRQTIGTKGAVYSVWAIASNDVWVGGTEVWHFDGSAWRVVHEAVNPSKAIWSDNSGDVWLAAADVLRCNLHGCTQVPSPVGEQFDVWGTSANDVWTLGVGGGMHWNGSSWDSFEVPTSLTSIHGGAPFGLIAVGHFGRMFLRKGTEWVDLRRAIGSVWTDIWGFSDNDIWISGNSMAHYDGRGITLSATPTDWGLQTVRGATPGDVWAAGCNGTLIHWDSVAWADFSIKPWTRSDDCLWSLWSDSSRSAFAGGSQGIALHWDGTAWSGDLSLPANATSRALFGIGKGAFAADDSGVVWQKHEDGWQAVFTFASTRANGLWGSSGRDLWVVGEYANRGLAVHWLEGSVSERQVDTTELTGVSGTSNTDVWFTGDGSVFHYDGLDLAEQPSGVHINNSKLWISPSGVRWMVGGNGILRHSP